MQVSDSAIKLLAGLLEAQTGQQLTMHRRWRIESALASLLRERGIATLDELITRLVLEKDHALSQQVVEALLNNETYFFRDRAPFDLLALGALPELRRRRQAEKRLRIWSAGCSTGQEVYSLAMLFEDDPGQWDGWTIEILGTDVSRQVIERAKSGLYTQFEVQRGLAITQTVRWFDESGGSWKVSDKLRSRVRFQTHNLLTAPPAPGRFDIILCRNVLLYLCARRRADAFDRLASALAPDGWLMLGAGETVIGQSRRLHADQSLRGLYCTAAAHAPASDSVKAVRAAGG